MCGRAGVTIILGVICGAQTNSTGQKPGLRPIGVREVLRRIAGKVVMMLFKNDITHVAGALQLSAGQDAGVEAVVHAMHDIIFQRKHRSRFTNRCRKRFQFDQSKGNASWYEISSLINFYLYM